jgi:hypothetical protein
MFKKIMEWLAGKPEGGIEQPAVTETATVVVKQAPEIKVTEVKPVEVAPKANAKDLESMDKKALLAKAKELGVAVNGRMNKEDIKNKILRG